MNLTKNIMKMNKVSFLPFLTEKRETERKCVQIPMAESEEMCSCISGCFFLCHSTVIPVQIFGGRAFVSKSMHMLTVFSVKVLIQQILQVSKEVKAKRNQFFPG